MSDGFQHAWGKMGKGSRKFSATFVSLLRPDEDDPDNITYLPNREVSVIFISHHHSSL